MKIGSEKISHETAKAISQLLEICNERHSGFKTAAKEVKDQELRSYFNDMSTQSLGFQKQLLAYINEKQKDHKHTSTESELWETWIQLKGAITKGSRRAIIDACLTGENFAIHAFEKVSKQNLPVDLLTLTKALTAQIKNSYMNLKSIKLTIAE